MPRHNGAQLRDSTRYRQSAASFVPAQQKYKATAEVNDQRWPGWNALETRRSWPATVVFACSGLETLELPRLVAPFHLTDSSPA